MKINRKVVAIAAAVAVVAAGGVGIAYAVGGGDSEEQVTGPDAEKAKSAAIDAAGGGTVLEAEYQEAGSAGFYEVEVERPDGSVVEVHIDGQFQPVGTAADDDSGAEDKGAEDESTEGAEDE
jgi:Peptidase propeptide and YPEB domain